MEKQRNFKKIFDSEDNAIILDLNLLAGVRLYKKHNKILLTYLDESSEEIIFTSEVSAYESFIAIEDGLC